VFLEELAVSGMHLDRQRAGELITGQVRAVAALIAVTEATARSYLGEEIITDMARRMLFEVSGERPGADLLAAPRTVPLPLALVGITVAALAEAMQVRAANEPPDHLRDVITTYAQTLSGFGQITADAGPGQAGDPAEILFQPALLRRAARYVFSGGPDGQVTLNPRVCPAQKPYSGDSSGATGVVQASLDPEQRCVVAAAIFSGLVMMAYRAAGVSLPRTTFQQVYAGTAVYSFGDLMPGICCLPLALMARLRIPGTSACTLARGWSFRRRRPARTSRSPRSRVTGSRTSSPCAGSFNHRTRVPARRRRCDRRNGSRLPGAEPVPRVTAGWHALARERMRTGGPPGIG
jgi:hypothetical protein